MGPRLQALDDEMSIILIVADDFAEFFPSNIDATRVGALPGAPLPAIDASAPELLSARLPIRPFDVEILIKQAARKTCQLDPTLTCMACYTMFRSLGTIYFFADQ